MIYQIWTCIDDILRGNIFTSIFRIPLQPHEYMLFYDFKTKIKLPKIYLLLRMKELIINFIQLDSSNNLIDISLMKGIYNHVQIWFLRIDTFDFAVNLNKKFTFSDLCSFYHRSNISVDPAILSSVEIRFIHCLLSLLHTIQFINIDYQFVLSLSVNSTNFLFLKSKILIVSSVYKYSICMTCLNSRVKVENGMIWIHINKKQKEKLRNLHLKTHDSKKKKCFCFYFSIFYYT